VRYGAERVPVVMSDLESFIAACLRLDRAEVQAQLARHPEYLQRPEPLLEAGRRNRVDVVEFLLDFGMSPDVENDKKERALHMAGYSNALEVAQLLIERGAEIDPVESNWSNTPLGAAVYAQHARMIELLGRYSSDIWEVNYSGQVSRVRELLAARPELARITSGGHSLLMWLPTQDEALALEAAKLLLDNGADPALRNKQGMTAADRAEKAGMFEVAALLRSASSEIPSTP
jgi:ankyrin repeat protein